MNRQHHYSLQLQWTGNKGEGTSNYRAYDRSYTVQSKNKIELQGSSDPAFRGDASKYNPEEMLVASLSACHMLWYLHLCAEAGIVVEKYTDEAKGTMVEDDIRGGYFSEVILYPQITLKDNSRQEEAAALHHKANKMCFIANSCNFPVRHEARIVNGESHSTPSS